MTSATPLSPSAGRPQPGITAFSQPFWRAVSESRFEVQFCGQCDRYIHPPGPICPTCHARDLTFRPISGAGRIDAYTRVRRVFHPAFEREVPYILARIALIEQDDLFVFANILNPPPDDALSGRTVRAVFVQSGETTLLQFVCVPGAGAT